MQQKPPENEADRRASPRSPIVVREARCIAGMEVFFGCATNISCSGMFITSPKLRAPDQEFDIQFRLPADGREICCRARVVWSRHYRHDSKLSPGFGLQFLNLAEEDAHAIDTWVASSRG